jgi:hypothetical protein
MRKSLRPFAAALFAIGVATIAAPSAFAAAPTGNFAQFEHCPYTNPSVQTCLYSKTTTGSFKLGASTVPITAPIVLQGGFAFDPDTSLTTVFPAVGTDTLSKTPLNVPGGLLGLVNPGGFFGLLEQAFENAISSANGVTATAELVGPAKLDIIALLFTGQTAMTMPIRVHLENPFLGPSCYIGSPSNPITMQLRTGTTVPPAGTAPITGSPGTPNATDDGAVTTSTGVKLVDNTFAVPAATNCGNTFLDKLLVTPAVNLKQGLPSAAGQNSAILGGTSAIGTASAVAASVQ